MSGRLRGRGRGLRGRGNARARGERVVVVVSDAPQMPCEVHSCCSKERQSAVVSLRCENKKERRNARGVECVVGAQRVGAGAGRLVQAGGRW